MSYCISYADDYEMKDEGFDHFDERENDENEFPANNQAEGSDEDTEEASETDMGRSDEPMEIKEQMYQDKLASLKKQLQQLKDGSHPELNRRFKRLEHQYRERLRLNEIHRDYMVDCVERDYLLEKDAATKEFREKKEDLKETLINDLEDKRKQIESDRYTMELTGDSTEVKPVMTRKLRRRPNDPMPVLEKRRKPPTAQLVLLLDDKEIESDLKQIARGKPPPMMVLNSTRNDTNLRSQSPLLTISTNNNNMNSTNQSNNISGSSVINSTGNITNNRMSPINSNTNTNIVMVSPRSGAHTINNNINSNNSQSIVVNSQSSVSPGNSHHHQVIETRVEDGKLLYERRWFHRGQPVYIEGATIEGDSQKCAGNISAIGAEAIWVKKQDGNKFRISVSQLSRGKISIKRRAL